MKTKVLLSIMLIILMSCNKDNTNEQNTDNLIGTWNLVSFEPGFAQTENYNNGDVNWNFTSNNTVEVVINTSVSNILPLNTPGIYSYNLISNDSVIIDNHSYKYELSNQSLRILNNPSADGCILIFEKIN